MTFKTGEVRVASLFGRLVPFLVATPAVRLSIGVASFATRLVVTAARRLTTK